MGCQPRIVLFGAFFALLLGPRVVSARAWHITPDGTGDAPTIQAGIDSAAAGDEVVLAAGIYTWTSQGAGGSSMVRLKPGVTLRSESGPETTILDAEFSVRQAPGRVILCYNVGDVRIEGLTLQNGFAQDLMDPPNLIVYGRGGGLYAFGDSRPTISHCIVKNNGAGNNGSGGGIACAGEATIEDCQILDNTVAYDGTGGGISLLRGIIARCTVRGNQVVGDGAAHGGGISTGGTVMDCRIEGNQTAAPFGASAGGVGIGGGGSIIRCTIIRNRTVATLGAPGGGVLVGSGTCRITDCVFIANTSNGGFGGALSVSGGAQAIVSGCTLVGNRATGSSGPIAGLDMYGGGEVSRTIVANGEGTACGGQASFSCTDLFGNTNNEPCGTDNGGNFSADPQFCADDPTMSLNVLLQSDSPCLPGNHPNQVMCGLIGAAPVGCQSVAVEQRTWSEVKSFYYRR